MNTQDLKKYIDKVLGNNIRCLLPSYWWKRLFNLLLDEVDKVNRSLKKISVDTSMSDTSNNPISNRVVKSYIDSATNVPQTTIYRTYNDTYLSPNTYYKVTSEVSSLYLQLETPTDTSILNNYMIEFTTSATSAFTLYASGDIKWANGIVPTFDLGCTYQISIINNLAVISMFE